MGTLCCCEPPINMKAYLDIDIGDAARYATELAAWQRAADFCAAVGSQVWNAIEAISRYAIYMY